MQFPCDVRWCKLWIAIYIKWNRTETKTWSIINTNHSISLLQRENSSEKNCVCESPHLNKLIINWTSNELSPTQNIEFLFVLNFLWIFHGRQFTIPHFVCAFFVSSSSSSKTKHDVRWCMKAVTTLQPITHIFFSSIHTKRSTYRSSHRKKLGNFRVSFSSCFLFFLSFHLCECLSRIRGGYYVSDGNSIIYG